MVLLARFFIRGYQLLISPVLSFLAGPGNGCRFTPTCSAYFLEALETHGVFRGTRLGLWRLCRCNPWGGRGHDPVPPRMDSDRLAVGRDVPLRCPGIVAPYNAQRTAQRVVPTICE
ncbi:MAG TPA: membrane protein insertion efficiency factor YidD [Chthoniobacterales bacterium]|nr:membrane protein insertion efficiency factor YidD [Chthoniobacterales bacterium]